MKRFRAYVQEKFQTPEKSLGINRKDMPQIDSEDTLDFVNFAKKQGFNATNKKIDPNKLRATQNQFQVGKIKSLVDKIESGEYDNKIILVSKDNRVMDGHHRWLAHKELGKDIAVKQFDLTASKLFDLMHDYPKSYKKKLNETFDTVLLESGETCAVISREQMSTFEKVVDKLFAKFNIDFDFTKHFRERMSDERNKPCIDIRELAGMIQKIYKKVSGGQNILAKHKDAEAVIKDLQTDLNMPVAIEYDRKNDELTVIGKTIMRKKNFTTPNPVERV
jgi:hypothetical protein